MSNLTALKKEHYGFEPYSVCDIEAPGFVNFLVIGHFDGINFRYFTRLQDFFRYLVTHPHSVIYAHFGGKFDFLYLLEYLLGSSTWQATEIIPRGSSMLCLRAEHESGVEIEFRDSAAMLPFSLAKLTTTFPVKHRKLQADFETMHELKPEDIRYLEHDCRGLHEVIEHYFSYPLVSAAGPAPTVAGQAMRILRMHLTENFHMVGLGKKIDAFVRESYIAGRTEIFRPIWPPKPDQAGIPLYCYDVSSLFPYCMSQAVPGNFRYWTREYEPREMGVYNATVHVPEDTYIPILGKKMETKDGQTKLVFPVGTFSGRWTTMELEYAKTCGVEVLKTGVGAIFQNMGKVFEPFVRAVYALKQNSGEGTVDYMVAKLLLNSCYGRFGIRRERSMLAFDEGREGWSEIREFEVNGKRIALGEVPSEYRGFSNVATAAWITARARVHMHRLMESIDFDVYYTDTDSVFTPRKMECGEELGDLKLVKEYDEAVFLLPKTYATRSKENTEVRMKGIDRKAASAFSMREFHEALEGERKLIAQVAPRFATLRSALRSGKLVTMLPAGKKEIRAVYSKRNLFENALGWNSRPIIIKKGSKNEHRKSNSKRRKKDDRKLHVHEGNDSVRGSKREHRGRNSRPVARTSDD